MHNPSPPAPWLRLLPSRAIKLSLSTPFPALFNQSGVLHQVLRLMHAAHDLHPHARLGCAYKWRACALVACGLDLVRSRICSMGADHSPTPTPAPTHLPPLTTPYPSCLPAGKEMQLLLLNPAKKYLLNSHLPMIYLRRQGDAAAAGQGAGVRQPGGAGRGQGALRVSDELLFHPEDSSAAAGCVSGQQRSVQTCSFGHL